MRKPSTFAIKMKKELQGASGQLEAIQDDMWDYEDEEVEVSGQAAWVSIFPLEVSGFLLEKKEFLEPFHVHFKYMDKVSMVPRSEVERVIVSNVVYDKANKKLDFDSNTFVSMSKLLELKATRRDFTSSFGKLITSDGEVILLRFRMPRFQIKINDQVYYKFFSPDELQTILQAKLSGWQQILADIAKENFDSDDNN